MDLCEIIQEAKCCSAHIASTYVKAAIYGNDNPEAYYNMLRMNAYIRTLERNQKVVTYEKEKIPFNNQQVTFSMLKKKNSFLTLEIADQYICVKKTTEPCLSDSELCDIIEQVRFLCSSCNCNCN